MRKDLRLGLGIGALALIFAITFLVVRNHSQNQSDGEQAVVPVAALDGSSAPPGANVPAATGGGGTQISTIILPPLQPVPPGAPKPAPDPFDRRTSRPPAEAAVPSNTGRSGSNWDALLSEGRRDPVSGAALNRAPAPSVTSDPIRQVTHVEPLAPRPSAIAGQLSAVTGRPYTIRQGDTFSSLAKQTYGAEKYYLQIEQANPNVNTMRLRPGQQIILPELAVDARATKSGNGFSDHESDNRPVDARIEYRVDTGDSLYRISMKIYGTPRMTDEIYVMNRAAIGANPDRLRLGMILRLPRPVDGK